MRLMLIRYNSAILAWFDDYLMSKTYKELYHT